MLEPGPRLIHTTRPDVVEAEVQRSAEAVAALIGCSPDDVAVLVTAEGASSWRIFPSYWPGDVPCS